MQSEQLRAHDDSVEALRLAVKRSRDEAQKTRIRAIISIKEGVSQTDAARRFAVCHNTVRNWIAAYEKGGVTALAMSKGGRPEGNPHWDASIFEELAKEIDKGGYWSVPKMQEWIKEHHKKNIPEQTVWYRMDQLDYSYKSARPHPMQGNKERQETFKKGASYRSWSR